MILESKNTFTIPLSLPCGENNLYITVEIQDCLGNSLSINNMTNIINGRYEFTTTLPDATYILYYMIYTDSNYSILSTEYQQSRNDILVVNTASQQSIRHTEEA